MKSLIINLLLLTSILLPFRLYSQHVVLAKRKYVILNTDKKVGAINDKIILQRKIARKYVNVGRIQILKFAKGRTIAKIINQYKPYKIQIGDEIRDTKIAQPPQKHRLWWLKNEMWAVDFELSKPTFNSERNGFISHSAYSLSMRFPIRRRSRSSLFLTAQVPVSYARFGDLYPSPTETTIGNVYLGTEFHNHKRFAFTELGLRLPVVSDDQRWAVSKLLFNIDEWEAFMPNTMMVYGILNFINANSLTPHFRFRAGPVLWIHTDKPKDNLDTFILYSGHARGAIHRFTFEGSFSGRMYAGYYSVSFWDRFLNQISLSTYTNLGLLKIGVQYTLPLKSGLFKQVENTLGVICTFQLN